LKWRQTYSFLPGLLPTPSVILRQYCVNKGILIDDWASPYIDKNGVLLGNDSLSFP
jgi:hypothetical protein